MFFPHRYHMALQKSYRQFYVFYSRVHTRELKEQCKKVVKHG